MSYRPVCPLCGESVKGGLGYRAGLLPVSAGTDWDPQPIPSHHF